MAAAAAEQTTFENIYDTAVPHLALVEDLPDIDDQPVVQLARDTEYAQFTEARFDRWYGSIALGDVAKPIATSETEQQAPETSLLDMLKAAPRSAEARAMVGENVAAANGEICFKDRHIRGVTVERNKDGHLSQFGQTMISVHSNSITERPNRHPILQDITKTEALNFHDIDDGLRAGELKDNYHVAVSIVPAGVPEKELGHKGDGYFLDSLTFVIQAATEQTNAKVGIESAFMAGVEAAEDLGFEERLEARIDIAILTKVYERLKLESPTTAQGFLKGVLVPKELMPNGVADFVRWCDEAADEIKGATVERKPEDYLEMVEESKRREASLALTNQKVLNDLIEQGQHLTEPIDAIRLMWQLAKKYTVEAAFINHDIDPRVFGSVSAPYIMRIRQFEFLANQDTHSLDDLIAKAHETAVITTCGGGDGDEAQSITEAIKEALNSKTEKSNDSDEFGPLTFTCRKGHTNRRPRGKLIPYCRVCHDSVKC